MNVTSISVISGSSSQSGTAPDLSAIVDDTTGKYTDAEKTLAFQEREARDQGVIGPAFQKSIANGDSTLPWRAALSLLNSLSPAEQNSPRYAGTRQEIMLAISTNDGPSTWKSGPPGVEQITWGVKSSDSNKAKANSLFGSMKFLQATATSQAATAIADKNKVIGPSQDTTATAAQSKTTTTSDLPVATAELSHSIDRTV